MESFSSTSHMKDSTNKSPISNPNICYKPLIRPSPILSSSSQEIGSMWKKRAILQEARTCLDSIRGTKLFEMLDYQNLLNFTSQDFQVYEELVEWFYRYATIKCDPNEIEGKKLVFEVTFPYPYPSLVYNDVDLLNDFGLHCDGKTFPQPKEWIDIMNTPYEKNKGVDMPNNNPYSLENEVQWPSLGGMNGDEVVIAILLVKNLLPIPSKKAKFSNMLAYLLSMVQDTKKVNWPYLIAYHMKECRGNAHGNFLPYGGLVSHIVINWRVFGSGTKLLSPHLIDSLFLASVDIYKVGSKLVRGKDKETLDEIERWVFDKALEQVEKVKSTELKKEQVNKLKDEIHRLQDKVKEIMGTNLE